MDGIVGILLIVQLKVGDFLFVYVVWVMFGLTVALINARYFGN